MPSELTTAAFAPDREAAAAVDQQRDNCACGPHGDARDISLRPQRDRLPACPDSANAYKVHAHVPTM